MLDKTFDPENIEEKHYRIWEESGAFACDPQSDKTPFTIMMPPPNVTGSLHIGHALNHTLQDILTRYNRMKGKDALWQPGTDHAGIATQMVVERLLDSEGVNRRDLGREKFLERVWEWKEQSGGTIVNQLRRLGTTPDWERERFTMDEGLSKAVIKVFVQLHKDGLIYRDKRLVNWDPKFETAISDVEVTQREQKGHMWHLRYPVEGTIEQFITVATTRPETMLGDTAVAVHPDDDRYKDMIGKSVVLPITGRLIPIIADEYADPEQGSGAVKITPAHDFNDFEVGRRHDLPMINLFDTRACMNDAAPEAYRGLNTNEARKKILVELEELDCLVEVTDIKHAVPYGERSNVVIEPYLTDQWYVDTPTLAKPALKAVRDGQTTFHPKQYENMYFDWMENQIPWCISRQLWWGHQIPAWFDEDGNIFVAENEEEAQKQAGESAKLTQDEDVLDTWFSSALWPFSTIGWPEEGANTQNMIDRYYPSDVLVTGFDIITFWVSRMMMMGIHFMKDVPFKDVYVHALVRDSKGQKMSKSKGNVMDPLDIIEQYGADALRFTLTAMAAQGRDIKLSDERLQGYRNFATKLWNATRYCEMNECLPKDAFDPASIKHPTNKWIVSSLVKAKADLEKAIETYRFNDAANAAYHFTWGTFCDWYLEFTKPILEGDDAAAVNETRATTGWVLEQVLILLNPFMPFITEELYASIAPREKGQTLLTASWPDFAVGLSSDGDGDEMEWVQRLISDIRSVRADMNVPAGAKIALLVKDASEKTQERLKTHADVIKRMARLETIDLTNDIPKGSIQSILEEATLALPIADIIDLDKESARLRKKIAELEGDIKKIEQKLANKKFVENAPEEIIQEQHSRKDIARGTVEKLNQALQQLDAA